uniref:Uncharacterized protein n=2 Tax=Amphimedon queenslandica TaxID=400682 RepID=A0A1X7T942_AMPQE
MMMQSKASLYFPYHLQKKALHPSELTTTGGIEAHKDSEFITTMEDTYQYTGRQERGQLSRLTLNEKNGVTSIPFGDRNKELNMTSEQMKSYCVHVPHDDGEEGGEGSSSKGYDKRVAHDKTYKSSIKMMKDNKGKTYHEKVNEYPIYNSSAERQTPVQYERNFSSLPSGDLCPERVKERMTFLTSSVFSKPPPNSFPTYENKSRLRTHSNVHLGSSSVFGFPLTTSLESYKGDKGELYRARAPTKDNIAFQYKPDKPLVSTVKDSYDVKKVAQRSLNKRHLKKSHWKLPKTEVSFATTNQTHFLPPPPSFKPLAPVYPSKT